MLEKAQILKTCKNFEDKTEVGRGILKKVGLDQLAYAEWVLSMDVGSSSTNIAYGIMTSCRKKEYEDGNTALALNELKKNFELYICRCIGENRKIV
jgi:hypothetical protein